MWCVWCVVCGVWCVVCGVCGVWCVVLAQMRLWQLSRMDQLNPTTVITIYALICESVNIQLNPYIVRICRK